MTNKYVTIIKITTASIYYAFEPRNVLFFFFSLARTLLFLYIIFHYFSAVLYVFFCAWQTNWFICGQLLFIPRSLYAVRVVYIFFSISSPFLHNNISHFFLTCCQICGLVLFYYTQIRFWFLLCKTKIYIYCIFILNVMMEGRHVPYLLFLRIRDALFTLNETSLFFDNVPFI